MKKGIILISIVAFMILMAGWNSFDGLQDHGGVEEPFSSQPEWGQRATGLWALDSSNAQSSLADWTQRATGSWAFVSSTVLIGSR